MVEKAPDVYGPGFRRARLDAARRLPHLNLLDKKETAGKLGISPSMLKQIENGQKRPSFETLLAMARAYNVLPGDLLPSTLPKGAEIDRVLGPLMELPPTPRGLLLTQFEGMARALAASIADAQAQAEAAAAATAYRDEDEEGGREIAAPVTPKESEDKPSKPAAFSRRLPKPPGVPIAPNLPDRSHEAQATKTDAQDETESTAEDTPR